MLTFQQLILRLQDYWAGQGCALLQPFDMEVGAGTSHTATFLRALGPEPWQAAYVQPSRRPKDGRYGNNPNRLQHYYQYQVVLKPAPANILALYLGSLQALGFDLTQNDVRFVEDDRDLGKGQRQEELIPGFELNEVAVVQMHGDDRHAGELPEFHNTRLHAMQRTTRTIRRDADLVAFVGFFGQRDESTHAFFGLGTRSAFRFDTEALADVGNDLAIAAWTGQNGAGDIRKPLVMQPGDEKHAVVPEGPDPAFAPGIEHARIIADFPA